MVWLMALFFAIYAGVESSGGQWSFSLFESRHIDETTAGLWVSVYWASLTAGRVVFGALSVRFNAFALLRWCIYGMIAGALLIWLNLSNSTSFLGLAILGFLQAPIFPIMVSKTPQIVGHSHAANSIGFQVAAAGIGLAALPALAGVLADRTSIEVVGPFLAIFSIAIYILYEIVVHVKR
jgi:fucose permease